MLEILRDKGLTWKDKIEILNPIPNVEWKIKRLYCLIFGCDVHSWSENEYIYGLACPRCGGYDSTTNDVSPYSVIEEGEALWDKLLWNIYYRFEH